MNKTYVFIALAITIAIAVSIINGLHIIESRQVIKEDFEQTLGENFREWTANKHVPLDPNNPGYPVQWHIRRVSNISNSGTYSAEFFIDGKQDDGTIWLERKISVKEKTQIRVSISFWLYSEQESFNTIAAVVAYVGTSKPDVEDDFVVVGFANDVAGWKNYVYTADLTTGLNGKVWVAVGISVRWETYMTYYIDDIKIEVA